MEDEDEDGVRGIVQLYKGSKKKNTSVPFLWGSHLHKMIDPEKPNQFDIVDFSEDSMVSEFSMTKGVYSHKTTEKSLLTPNASVQNDKNYEATENTFARFGYSLPDIDTSDEENIDMSSASNGDVMETKSQNLLRGASWSHGGFKVSAGRLNYYEIQHDDVRDHDGRHESEQVMSQNHSKTNSPKDVSVDVDSDVSILKNGEQESKGLKATDIGVISTTQILNGNLADSCSLHNLDTMSNIQADASGVSLETLQPRDTWADDEPVLGLSSLKSTQSDILTPEEANCVTMNETANNLEVTPCEQSVAKQENVDNLSKTNHDRAHAQENSTRKISNAADDTSLILDTQEDMPSLSNNIGFTPSNNTKTSSVTSVPLHDETRKGSDNWGDKKTFENKVSIKRQLSADKRRNKDKSRSFYRNIKPPSPMSENKPNHSPIFGQISSTKDIKKEFDNSVQVITELCSIGSTRKKNHENELVLQNTICQVENETNALSRVFISEESELNQLYEKHNDFDKVVEHEQNLNKMDDFTVRHFNKGNKLDKMSKDIPLFKTVHRFQTNDDILSRIKTECQKLESSHKTTPNGSNIPYITKKQNIKKTSTDTPKKKRESLNPGSNYPPSYTLSFEEQAHTLWGSQPTIHPQTTSEGHWDGEEWTKRDHFSSSASRSSSSDSYDPWNSYNSEEFSRERSIPPYKGRSGSFGPERSLSLSWDTNQSWGTKHNENDKSWNDKSDTFQYKKVNTLSSLSESMSPSSNSMLTSRGGNKCFSRGRGNSRYRHTGEDDCNCTSCTVKQLLKQLTQFMDSIGYEVKNVSSDGNCLFAAVVDQLKINGDFSYTVDSLRQKSVEYLRKRPHVEDDTHLEAFLTNETWNEYLERMEMDGEWGDDIILRGISEMTGRRIIVYSSFVSKTILTPTEVYEHEDLCIGHIRHMMHFVSLRPKLWDISWPLHVIQRRQTALIDNLKMRTTVFDSLKESVNEKFDALTVSMSRGDIKDTYNKFDEIKQMLKKENLPVHQELLVSEESLETMDKLIQDKFEVDQISGTPILHFTFLIKLLIERRYFRSDDTEFRNLFDTYTYILSRIGCSALGLDTQLIDFTDAMQHYSMFEKTPKESQTISLTFIMKPPNDQYEIQDNKHPLTDKSLVINDTETYPGYLRLTPINPAPWTGYIEWVSPQETFLRGVKVKHFPKDFLRDFTKFSINQMKGLECSFWPEQANSWIKRIPISGWPSVEKISEASGKGCLIIRRAHELSDYPDIEWQFVFNEAEKVLVESFSEHMLYCFRVFKAMVDHQTRNLKVRLKTYYLLTTMFYCSEIIQNEYWSTNAGGCILYLVAWLLRHVRMKEIPHYFIPENNMVEHIEDQDLRMIEYSLQALRCFPFASVYFLLESHSFMYLNVIDQIGSSIDEYKQSKDKRKIVEKVFTPIAFKLASQQLKHKLLPFCESALEYIEHAYEQIVSVADEGCLPTFENFVLTFLTTVNDESVKKGFAQVVDKIKKTDVSRTVLQNKVSKRISDILGPEYTGELRHVYVDISDDKWNAIYEITGSLYVTSYYQECAEILRSSISVLQKELKSEDYSETEKENMNTQHKSSKYKHVYISLRYLVTFYKHLSKCYDAMDQVELFQEHIHDYEETAGRIDSYMHYETLAKLYRQLGNSDKAKELDEKVKTMKPKGGGEGQRGLLLFIV